MRAQSLIVIAQVLGTGLAVLAQQPGPLALQKGDHIAYIGNALADRMSFEGHLETLLHAAFPSHSLTIRNLGFAGDEVALRMRSDDFGTPDEWLTKVKADVIFAFFGFNESFRGDEGLAKFVSDYDAFVKDTLKKNYSGRGAPRLVLFSPIACEKLDDPDIRDPAPSNDHLAKYVAAMSAVAGSNRVPFVDLFAASQELYRRTKKPLTFNGIHLNAEGNRLLADTIFAAALGVKPPAAKEKLRTAVVEKNEIWRSRYRTVDGYNVYGGRSKLSYPQGKGGPSLSNFEVMQQEMAVRDVMTENRDKRIWAVAQGGDLKVDDANVPEVAKVKTNRPGPNPDESHVFLNAEEAIQRMKVAKGVKVNLFASEEQFPELIKPVQMAWDTKGRLWVSAWRTYPERTPWDEVGDRIIILEDRDGDGRADKCSTFMDDLNCPTGFQFHRDGILLMQAPDLWFVRDTDGDGKADWKERVLMGIDSADSHHTANSMCLEPGGATYLSDGVFHRTQVETPWGVVRNTDGCIYRYEPRTHRFERYAAYGFANPHGRVFDYWGNDYITDGTGNANYFGPAFSGRLDYPDKHNGMEQWWQRPARPCAGSGMLSSKAWPDDFNGNYLNCNVISVQGIFRVKVTEEGSGMKGETLEHFVSSDDPTFRPVAVNVGPDGAVYFADWANAIIGHMQHHIRDPNRDHVHGRLYRAVHEAMKPVAPAKIDGQSIAKLLELLKDRDDGVRERAKIELGKRDTADVAKALDKWTAKLDGSDPDHSHHVTEALWVKQWHNVVDTNLLRQVLASPDYHARAAATRVLCYWRDRVPDVLDLLMDRAVDEHPRVRLEALRAASFFDGAQAVEAVQVAQETLRKPSDYYLDYTYKETMRQLEKFAKNATLPTDPAMLMTVIGRMTDNELLRAQPVEPVLNARIERPGLKSDQRQRAVADLAKLHGQPVEAEVATLLQRFDAAPDIRGPVFEDLAKQVAAFGVPALSAARPAFAALAQNASTPAIRRIAWLALIRMDNQAAATWNAAKTPAARQAVAEALPLVFDGALRAGFQPLIVEALQDQQVPAGLRAAAVAVLPLLGAQHAKQHFGILADFLARGIERNTAAGGIKQLPRDTWDATRAEPAVHSVLAWAKTVPQDRRSSQEFIEVQQAALELASLLPPSVGTPIRRELRNLGVSVFVIKTVREQMRYDTARIVVEAGKPFEVIFENEDMMPHNIVFVQPTSRQAVAESAQLMKMDQLDRQGRAFIPKDDKRILEASKLLEAGQKQRLRIEAPKTPGEYEYVCTFPGHWMIMWGKMVVVKDVDAELAKGVEGPAPTVAPAAGHAHHP